jgi:membrane-associated protease RseP (regulator of RpoE activity)
MSRYRSPSGAFRSSLVLAGLAFAGCSSMVAHFGGGVSKELRQNGVVARATIQEIWDTGWTVNDNPVIGMKVLVLPVDRPAFTATIEKTTISRVATPQFQPGNSVPVRFDPRNQGVVAVDFAAELPAAAAPWGENRPAILGIAARSLSAGEQADLERQAGIVVESVLRDSPAAVAGIAVGDVLVAIDGQPLDDVAAVPARVAALAGRRVAIDLLRNRLPFSVIVQLNPAAP